MLELGSGFDYDLTGRENVFLNGAILGYSEAFLKEKFDGILAFSGWVNSSKCQSGIILPVC